MREEAIHILHFQLRVRWQIWGHVNVFDGKDGGQPRFTRYDSSCDTTVVYLCCLREISLYDVMSHMPPTFSKERARQSSSVATVRTLSDSPFMLIRSAMAYDEQAAPQASVMVSFFRFFLFVLSSSLLIIGQRHFDRQFSDACVSILRPQQAIIATALTVLLIARILPPITG